MHTVLYPFCTKLDISAGIRYEAIKHEHTHISIYIWHRNIARFCKFTYGGIATAAAPKQAAANFLRYASGRRMSGEPSYSEGLLTKMEPGVLLKGGKARSPPSRFKYVISCAAYQMNKVVPPSLSEIQPAYRPTALLIIHPDLLVLADRTKRKTYLASLIYLFVTPCSEYYTFRCVLHQIKGYTPALVSPCL